ncbi:SDR family oxidoreductase [uncultured Methanobacterium sp.]|uniref:SDR family NAD(P)-dependent oxidoreductase n=1 Tax=uncultured Methanobacterium sp. TaxID=176306 RepID=UPI002AA7261F|nr:SDR family oxidoreductase [uncultured Methanobacterium sp.]
MENCFDLEGKVAVVTGASGGLGADAAMAYAQNGADVALLARRKDRLEALAKEIESTGRKALAVQCDVANEESVENAIEEVINYFGKIDILLNNAGVAIRGGVCDLCVEDWDKGMDVNVKGIYLVSKHVIPHMIENNYGKVVNTSSINSVAGDKNDVFIRHVYNASKAAVRGLTMGMACSYGKYGITINAVGPGLFESEMTADTLFKSDDFLEAYSRIVPLNRPAKKGELNGPILFLSSEASSYVTGQTIFVDGGFSVV